MATRRIIRIQSTPIDVVGELHAVTAGDHSVGAVASFTGLVRGDVDGRAIVRLSLEHYPGMTETELGRIITEAEARWPLSGVLVTHRIGDLNPGEMIVLVAVASRHRHAAFEAAAYVMDFLKTRAPFWKREVYADGGERWVDARDSDHAATHRWLQKADA